MKQVETNFLIYDLAKKLNCKSRCSLTKFFFAVFGLSFLYTAYFLLSQELRPNLASVVNDPICSVFYLQLVVFAVGMVVGCYLCYQLAVPGLSGKTSYNVLNVLFYGLWITLIMVLLIDVYKELQAGAPLIFHFDCINRALLGLALPLGVTFYFVQKGFVINKFQTMLTVCLTAFSFASLLNLFICPATDAVHILFSHNLVILPIIMLFMVFCWLKEK